MAELRPIRAISIEKVRNLWRNAHIALKIGPAASWPKQRVGLSKTSLWH
jgi:hypothetical protein